MVIIDTQVNGYSHMTSDSIEELHQFAFSIGLKRCWYQNKRGKNQPHYDVNKTFFDIAIEKGAILVQRKELFLFLEKNYKK